MKSSIEEFQRIERSIKLSKSMVNIFYSTENSNNVVKNIELYLIDELTEKYNKNNEPLINEIKILDLYDFNSDNYNENRKKILAELENNVYIIDCTKAKELEQNFKNLSSFYYECEKKKTSFIYIFKQEDFRDYATTMRAYELRTFVFGELDKELETYNLYKSFANKYAKKNIKEIKNKI